MYLSWFYNDLVYNPAAITQTDINEFVSHCSSSGRMHSRSNYFRAFPQDAIQNVNYSKANLLTGPVSVVGAGYIPLFGSNVTIDYAFYGCMHQLKLSEAAKFPIRVIGFQKSAQTIIKLLDNFLYSIKQFPMSAVLVLILFMTTIYDSLNRQAFNLLEIIIDLDNTTKNIFIKEFFSGSSPLVRNISHILLNVKQTTCVYNRDNPRLLVNFIAKCKYSQSPSLLDLNTVPSTVVLTYYLHIIY